MNVGQWQGSDLILTLHVQPGASNSAFAGEHGDALKVRVQAQAQEGRANRELCRFIAEAFGVASSQITLLSGEGSRRKRICVHNPVKFPEDVAHLLRWPA